MRKILSLLVMAGMGACDMPPEPEPASANAVPMSAAVGSVSQDETPDQQSVALAVPGFGGYFLDLETGAPTVYLTDPDQRDAAATALEAFLASRDFTAEDLQVRQATYTYEELDAWYRQARPQAFAVDGIVLGDVDEASNRIRFGVSTPTAAAAVQGVLTELGIPAAAASVEQRAPIRTMATLRDEMDAKMGGIQLNFVNAGGVVGVSLLCTLGFNAISEAGDRSFITNSHCSTVEGGTETPTDYYQPLQDPDRDRMVNPENLIAVEADDPHWWTSLDCFGSPVLQCRYSDAARANYVDGVDVAFGRIARTVRPSTSLDDVVLDVDGEFRIRGEQARGVVGEVAHKVGRTTGWTHGMTTETCVDVLALGTSHVRLCQEVVSAVVDGGDSGSGVFRRRGGSNVILLGVLWGGSVDDANPEFVYSPMFGIERELGPLTTF